MEWMLLPLKRYAQFSGRSRRKEYWMYTLFLMIAGVVLGFVDGALGLEFGGEASTSRTGVLSSLFSLATLVPSIAVGVRRLHDTDRSGWWLLLPVAAGVVGAVIGAVIGGLGSGVSAGGIGWTVGLGGLGVLVASIVLLVFYVQDGQRGSNRFGPDPKDPAGDLADVFR